MSDNKNCVNLKEDLPGLNAGEKGTIAWALLALPLLLLIIMIYIPVLRTIFFGFTGWSGFEPPRIVGLANYANLFRDKVFAGALLTTLLALVNPLKYLIPAGLAVLAGTLAARSSGKGLVLARSVAGINLFGMSLASLGMGTILFLVAGHFKSLNQRLFTGFVAAEFAQIHFLAAIGLIFGSLLWSAIDKGNSRTIRDFILSAILLTAGFSLQTFTPWFLSHTVVVSAEWQPLPILVYDMAFRFMRLGYAATLSTVLILLSLIPGIPAMIRWSRRDVILWNRDPSEKESGPVKATAAVVIGLLSLVAVLPALRYFFYSFEGDPSSGFAQRFVLLPREFTGSNLSHLAGQIPLGSAIIRTGLVIFMTSLFQTLIAWLGGMALGRYRFAGRRAVTALVSLAVFLSPVVLIIPLFFDLRLVNLLDTFTLHNLMVIPLEILFFKAFYEGIRVDRDRIRLGADAAVIVGKNLKDTMLFMLGMFTLTLIYNANQVLIPLVTIMNPARYPVSILPLFTLGQYSSGQAAGGAMAYFLGMLPLSLFALLSWVILQVTFFSRSVILDRESARIPL